MMQIFGATGFVGKEYRKTYPVLAQSRENWTAISEEILYLISTTHNYHVVNGDSHIDIDTNLSLLMTVLDNYRAIEPKNGCFNFVSSWFVYGHYGGEHGAYETSECDPKGFYSITKRAAEQLLISYCETFDLNYRILRLGNVLGPDPRASKEKNALIYLINEMKADRDIELYEGGNFTRDYIDVKDCVRAIHTVVTKGKPNEIYNIGSGRPYIFADLIRYAHAKMDSKSKITNIEQKDFHKKVQSLNFYLNTDKLKVLGYKPQHNIYDTLDRLINIGHE